MVPFASFAETKILNCARIGWLKFVNSYFHPQKRPIFGHSFERRRGKTENPMKNKPSLSSIQSKMTETVKLSIWGAIPLIQPLFTPHTAPSP